MQLGEPKAPNVSFLGTRPIEDARTNTKNETLVGVLMHHMRDFGNRAIGHLTKLEQQIDPGPVLNSDDNLRLQVVLCVDVAKNRISPVSHHIIQATP